MHFGQSSNTCGLTYPEGILHLLIFPYSSVFKNLVAMVYIHIIIYVDRYQSRCKRGVERIGPGYCLCLCVCGGQKKNCTAWFALFRKH